MNVPVLAGIGVLLGLLFLASRTVARRPGFLAETFFRGHDIGALPPGTQEDDDFVWRWRASQPRIDPPLPRLAPVVPDPDEAPPPVAAQRLHGTVHRR